MALRLPGDIDFSGMMDARLKGVQLALGLEELSKRKTENATEALASDIASKSTNPVPMSTDIGGMNVNLGTKQEFSPDRYYENLANSGNSALVNKANEYQDARVKLAAQAQDLIKKKQENTMQENLNHLTALSGGLDMARNDPKAGLAYINDYEANYPDMGRTLDIQTLCNDKFRIMGVDEKGQNYSHIIDGEQIMKQRADANTQWVQYNENLRNQQRLAAERAKERDKTTGAEYINVVREGKDGRMKVSDIQEEYKRTHPEVKDDMSYQMLQMQASSPDAPQSVKDEFAKATEARGSMEHDFAAWAWNTLQADVLGLINSKEPIHWMGSKEPPAALMRGKARKDNATGEWWISNGKSWIKPTAAQQKQIDEQMKSIPTQ